MSWCRVMVNKLVLHYYCSKAYSSLGVPQLWHYTRLCLVNITAICFKHRCSLTINQVNKKDRNNKRCLNNKHLSWSGTGKANKLMEYTINHIFGDPLYLSLCISLSSVSSCLSILKSVCVCVDGVSKNTNPLLVCLFSQVYLNIFFL